MCTLVQGNDDSVETEKESCEKASAIYRRAEQVDVDEDVFAAVEVQLGSFEHDLAHGVGRRAQHHDYTRTRTQSHA